MAAGLCLGVLLATQAAVAGTVRDAVTGEPIAGAVVTLTDLNRAAVTTADGRYLLAAVEPGPQHLTVRFIGYDPRTIHALVPREGRLEIDIALEPRPVLLRAVEVRAPPTMPGLEVGDSTAFPDRGMSMAAVRHHPMLAEPDVLQALAGGSVSLKPESPSGVHVRGGSSEHTAYLLDGIPVFSPYHAAGVFSAWNPDALSRLRLSATLPSPALPDALAGAVEAVTLSPGPSLSAQGSLSTTQARVTADGPLGGAGGGYLVSARMGLANLMAPRDESSYLSDETADWLAKVEAPALGGQVRLLGYFSDNEIEVAAGAQPDPPLADSPLNAFEWLSRSLGAAWTRDASNVRLEVRGWSAAGDAAARWVTAGGPFARVAADRRDEGLAAAVERRDGHAITIAGVRLESSRTAYRIEDESGAAPASIVSARNPVAAAFLRHERALGRRVSVELGASLSAAAGRPYFAPRGGMRWRPWEPLTLSVSYARLHQFAQSLRNPESVVGNIFPADLFVGAGSNGVPVARSDLAVLAAELRPASGVRLGVEGYHRELGGLALVAPRAGEPFATGSFAVGSGTASGVSLDAAVSGSRYGLVASYGWQRLRHEYGDSAYVPGHGAAHAFQAGVIVFPTATWSFQLGASGAAGRRGTAVRGGLEWEACNLLDRGCEFAGSPRYGPEALAASALPAYLRVDLGVRKHWHVRVAGHDASIAVFGTVTNLFGRRNVLTYATDPATGETVEIDMRPLSPLVVGLDWRF